MRKITEKNRRQVRHRRIRARISGTQSRPRLYVFKSNQHIYTSLVDDAKGHTLISYSDISMKDKLNKTDAAKYVGGSIARAALDKGIKEVIFDRSGYKYHGRVKALAEGARQAGLKF